MPVNDAQRWNVPTDSDRAESEAPHSFSDLNALVYATGVPRSDIPNLTALIAAIRYETEAGGYEIQEENWAGLPGQLLADFRYLLVVPGSPPDGLVIPIGPIEALVTLQALDPVLSPALPLQHDDTSLTTGDQDLLSAPGIVNSVFQTGVHVQTHSGNTGATRATLGGAFGFGLSPGVAQLASITAGFTGAVNSSERSTTRVVDTEVGHVEDSRGAATLVTCVPQWSFRLRENFAQPWSSITASDVPTTDERLQLWIPTTYLEKASREQVTWNEADDTRLPSHYYSPKLTNLPALYDATLASLMAQRLLIDKELADELRRKIWNLDANLDNAINRNKGYRFHLHQDGRPIATVQVRTKRWLGADDTGPTLIGPASRSAHIENVRTTVDGTSGTHALGNSSTLSIGAAANFVPEEVPGLRLRAGFGPGLTYFNSDIITAGRTGLWVVVPRWTGYTVAYAVGFSHQVTAYVRGSEGRVESDQVHSRALLRLPEPDAYAQGFPVERTALDADVVLSTPVSDGDQTKPRTPVPPVATDIGPEALRAARDVPTSRTTPALPALTADGRGIGLGIADVSESTIEAVSALLVKHLTPYGFLPPTGNPFAGRSWYSHGNDLDSKLSSEELLEKMVSVGGFKGHWDEMHMDGMAFTLRRRRGGAGVDFDVDSARITITAAPTQDVKPSFLRSTSDWHTANLAMGLGTGQQSISGGRKISMAARFEAAFAQLRGAGLGIEAQRTVAATNTVSFISNRPELLEFPGTAWEFNTPTDLTIRIEFEHSGTQGLVKAGSRDPLPITLRNQPVTIRVIPLSGGQSKESTSATPATLLDHAVVYHLDTAGARAAAVAALPDLSRPSADADPGLTAFSGTTSLRAHALEIFNGEYTTDLPFSPGLFRDTHGIIQVSGRLGKSKFIGATDSEFTLGKIRLWLSQATQRDTSSKGITWGQLQIGAGENPDTAPAPTGATAAELSHPAPVPEDQTEAQPSNNANGLSLESGTIGLSRHWQWNTSRGQSRVGGKELLQLDFHRAYAFSTSTSLQFSSRQEKHAKLLPLSHSQENTVVPGKMIYLLSEPEALRHYGDGTLPVTDAQLADALGRWEKGQLQLSGNVAAAVLSRWASERPTPDADRLRQAQLLTELHAHRGTPVMDPKVRARFTASFPSLHLAEPGARTDSFWVPPYLVSNDLGGKALGHSGIKSLSYDGNTSAYKIIRDLVDKAAPGLLSADTEVWTPDGRVIGRRQGAVDALQSLFAHGREQAMMDDLLSRNGHSLYLVNPIGWLLADVVKINISSVLTGLPRYEDFIPGSGLENYTHSHETNFTAHSQEGAQNLTLGRLTSSTESGGGSAALALSSSHHRGNNRATTTVNEQTIYDWGGHFTAVCRHRMTVRVERMGMGGRPLNDYLADGFRNLKRLSAPVTTSVSGTLELQIPRSVAEMKPLLGPQPLRTPTPLPRLPGDCAIVAVQMDGLLPAAQQLLARALGGDEDARTTQSVIWELVARVFGSQGKARIRGKTGKTRARRGSATPEVVLSRSHLASHLRHSTGGTRITLADDLFLPGKSSERVKLSLTGELYDLEVLAPIQGSGAGRYSKSQSATTSFGGSDRGLELTASGSGFGSAVPQPASMSGEAGSSRITGPGQSSANVSSNRREQHVKEQGPMYLIRLRARHTLIAEKRSHHLFRSPTPGPTYTGPSVTGFLYAEIHQDTLDELLAKHSASKSTKGARHPTAKTPSDHKVPSSVFNLDILLAAAASEADVDHHRVLLRAAELIRAQHSGATPSLELRVDLMDRARFVRPALLAWAVEALRSRADLRDHPRLKYYERCMSRPSAELDRDSDPVREIVREVQELLDADSLAKWASRTLQSLPSISLISHQEHSGLLADYERALLEWTQRSRPSDVDEAIRSTNQVNELLSSLPNGSISPNRLERPPLSEPLRLPSIVALLSRDPIYIARDLAMEMQTEVILDIARSERKLRTWFTPAGRVHAFDPESSYGATISTETAQRAGLLTAELCTQAEILRFTESELGHIYRTSWQDGQTFEQALNSEINKRLEELEAIDPRIPTCLRDLHAVEKSISSLREEITRHQAQVADISIQIIDLDVTRVRDIMQNDRTENTPFPLKERTDQLVSDQERLEVKIAELGSRLHKKNHEAARLRLYVKDRMGGSFRHAVSDLDKHSVRYAARLQSAQGAVCTPETAPAKRHRHVTQTRRSSIRHV